MTELPGWLVPSDITGRNLDEAAEHIRTHSTAEQSGPWRYVVELAPAAVRVRRISTKPKAEYDTQRARRRSISGWSHKSRTRLIWRLATLDYSPMVADGRLPMLLTLTYPGDWQSVAPTGEAVKRHLAALRRRYERAFDTELFAVWVLEFQRNADGTPGGRPHFHLLVSIPAAREQEAREWFATTWPDIVAHPDPEQRRRHEAAGTQLKHSEHSLNPRVAAIYFAKHAAPGKGAKWYQKVPPQLWQQAGSVGRLWGYWRLTPSIASATVSRQDAQTIARKLRRWDQKRRGPQRVRVVRANSTTGEVRYRWVRRKAKPRMTATSGFLAVEHPLETLRELSILPPDVPDTLEQTREADVGQRTVQRRISATLRRQIREHLQRTAARAELLARLVLRRLRAPRPHRRRS